jgi:hypothetical protein
MNILTLICLLILSLVSVVALIMSAFGGFIVGMILALFSLIGCVFAADSILKLI